jgi:two-component system response regulator FlrC
VVEDDRAVRYLFTEVLRSAGHEVIACEDGVEALRSARRQLDRIDAVVTDSFMPGMDGHELIAEIRALRPEMPVLLVSGSVDDGEACLVQDAATAFLAKPIAPEQLKSELHRLLYGTM